MMQTGGGPTVYLPMLFHEMILPPPENDMMTAYVDSDSRIEKHNQNNSLSVKIPQFAQIQGSTPSY
ncbi:hypothetical protein [Labrenzia sp. 011]|uniref:hypothetical protein n=1 Tax=Labrenzia sp. 011 TaxID=2171494 RepID=UPI000D523FCF|nr:hypothetical protein [Labrenzia sp. 011]PVB60904.1 hypothetical protein DCO57_14635 [Labrenzia sp. 011]